MICSALRRLFLVVVAFVAAQDAAVPAPGATAAASPQSEQQESVEVPAVLAATEALRKPAAPDDTGVAAAPETPNVQPKEREAEAVQDMSEGEQRESATEESPPARTPTATVSVEAEAVKKEATVQKR